MLAHHAVRAHLAQRRAVRAYEEPADQGLVDPVARAPRLEALPPEDGDADLGAIGVVAGDVDRRPGTSAQEQAPAA